MSEPGRAGAERRAHTHRDHPLEPVVADRALDPTHVRRSRPLHGLHRPPQIPGRDHRLGVDPGHDRTVTGRHRQVEADRCPPARIGDDRDPGVLGRPPLEDLPGGVTSGTDGDGHVDHAVVVLVEHGVETVLDRLGRVEGGNDDGHAGRVGNGPGRGHGSGVTATIGAASRGSSPP